MAKFRDSSINANLVDDASAGWHAPAPAPLGEAAMDGAVHDRSIGDILADLRQLTADQVEKILVYQHEHGVRFGEAAVAMGFASKSDVLFALSQQFHYPYAPEERRSVSPELITLNEPFSARAESFRALRSQLMMRVFAENGSRHAVAVISPDVGDGKTYSAANLAVTLAQLGGRTLLVDADMRSPRVHEVFNLTNQTGLSSILSGRADKQVMQQVAGISSLFILPVGTMPPNPLELVERPAFGLLMRELASKFDHVIVDTPASSLGADAMVITARCGLGLLIARKNSSRVNALQEVAAGVAAGSARMAGVVVNEY